MDSNEAYKQQLQLINQMLEQASEGPERDELNNLKENIEELLSLTNNDTSNTKNLEVTSTSSIQEHETNSASNDRLEDEYALFMAEMSKEGAIEPSYNENVSSKSDLAQKLKDLEGKKFRAPHKHQWGQLVYHNAMVCSVPEDISDNNDELMVKILFLNPTHKEMLPCPYYFDLEKDCHFSEEKCKYSHGELVHYSSLQDYIEPKFEKLTKGSEVLAKQSDNLWYRGKISQISKDKCLVKFQSKNVENEDFEDIIFEHILPLDHYEKGSKDNSSESEEGHSDDEANEILEAKRQREELINKSLMITPESIPLGDWEKHTKGIGSKLMQKMGYIVGTGLGKEGRGIVKPVTALVLPQGKSLDFCMNLKEQAQDPHLFHADKISKLKKVRRGKVKVVKRKQKEVKLKDMSLEEFINWFYGRGQDSIKNEESQLLREKLKVASTKEVNLINFKISERTKKMIEDLEKIRASVQRMDGKLKTNGVLHKKLFRTETSLKRLNIFQVVVSSELDRRKNNKEMVF